MLNRSPDQRPAAGQVTHPMSICYRHARLINPWDGRSWSDLKICYPGHELLYRLRAADGELLYVGVTWTPKERWKNHRKVKIWWGSVDNVEVECHPSMEAALAAEWASIKTEGPRFNKQGAVR